MRHVVALAHVDGVHVGANLLAQIRQLLKVHLDAVLCVLNIFNTLADTRTPPPQLSILNAFPANKQRASADELHGKGTPYASTHNGVYIFTLMGKQRGIP